MAAVMLHISCQVCEESINTLVNLRGNPSFVADSGVAGEQRHTTGKDGTSIEVRCFPLVHRDVNGPVVVLGSTPPSFATLDSTIDVLNLMKRRHRPY